MLIRIRSKAGIWRITDIHLLTTVNDIKLKIENQYKIPIDSQILTMDINHTKPIVSNRTIKDLNLKHGDILYLSYEGDPLCTIHSFKRTVNADGSLSILPHELTSNKNGFRPGLKSLRDMKMHWTIGEFMDMDKEFEYKLKRQEKMYCKQLILDQDSCNDFQLYLRQFAFQQSRCGWLYGKKVKDEKTGDIIVNMEFIYEPPQSGDPYTFEVHDDNNMDKVDRIASYLKCEKVGWCFSHPPRENESYHFSSREILLTAQLQMDDLAEKNNYISNNNQTNNNDSSFVTLKVTLDKEGLASFEGFQVSGQCMDMFSSGALVENIQNPMTTIINDTFTAYVESKPTKEVDNNFFLGVVPVKQHQSMLINRFPKLNRDKTSNMPRNRETLALLLSEEEKKDPKNYVKNVISDFQVLLFLCGFLDINTDIASICDSIISNKPLEEGFQMIINSIAGRQR